MTVSYVDSSALAKLIVHEAESAALKRWMRGREVVTSSISGVEVTRLARRSAVGARPDAAAVLRKVGSLACDDAVIALAGRVPPPTLRSLDAIHLATALMLVPEVGSFVTYDSRLADAARTAGFDVVAPA